MRTLEFLRKRNYKLENDFDITSIVSKVKTFSLGKSIRSTKYYVVDILGEDFHNLPHDSNLYLEKKYVKLIGFSVSNSSNFQILLKGVW